MAALPTQVAHAQAHRTGLCRHPAAMRCRCDHEPRGAGTPAGDAQARTARAPEGRRATRPVRRLRADRLARRACSSARAAGVPVARDRSTSPKAAARDYWRTARALFAAGFRAGDLVHNSFSYHLTPAGSMMESGRARARLHGVSGRRRQHRAAAAGDRRAAARRLRRHAELPEDPAREGGRDAASCRHPDARRWCRRRGLSAVAARLVRGRAASTAYQCYATADLGLIAYETAAREGLVLDEGVHRSRSCGRAPATRCPRARSARSW